MVFIGFGRSKCLVCLLFCRVNASYWSRNGQTELCLELALERDRRLQGGLILGLRPGQLAPLLSLLEPPTHTAAGDELFRGLSLCIRPVLGLCGG